MDILALHGFTGCGADFAPMQNLFDGDWLCPDLPGHGPSPQLDCSPEAAIKIIQECTAKMASSSKRILIGYSMGARAALLHATRYPDSWDRLILIGSNPGIESETERAARRDADQHLAQTITDQGVAAFLENWQETPLIRAQKTIRADWLKTMQANRARHQASGLAQSLRQFGQGSVPNLWPEMTKLKMPVCLLTGALDAKYTTIAQRIARSLDNASHTIIPKASHMPHLEQPEQSAKVLHTFFQSA